MPLWLSGAKNTEKTQASPWGRGKQMNYIINILYLASKNKWNVEHEMKLANQKLEYFISCQSVYKTFHWGAWIEFYDAQLSSF